MATKFYKSQLAGLSVVVGDPDTSKGEVAPQTVRFEPYREYFRGDPVKVGYLQTDSDLVQKKLKEDANVQEITQKEYDEATGENADPVGY